MTTNEVELIYEAAERIVGRVRSEQAPSCLIRTYRLSAHRKGDDLRDPAEIDRWRQKDPLVLVRGKLPLHLAEEIECRLAQVVAAAIEQASR